MSIQAGKGDIRASYTCRFKYLYLTAFLIECKDITSKNATKFAKAMLIEHELLIN